MPTYWAPCPGNMKVTLLSYSAKSVSDIRKPLPRLDMPRAAAATVSSTRTTSATQCRSRRAAASVSSSSSRNSKSNSSSSKQQQRHEIRLWHSGNNTTLAQPTKGAEMTRLSARGGLFVAIHSWSCGRNKWAGAQPYSALLLRAANRALIIVRAPFC